MTSSNLQVAVRILQCPTWSGVATPKAHMTLLFTLLQVVSARCAARCAPALSTFGRPIRWMGSSQAGAVASLGRTMNILTPWSLTHIDHEFVLYSRYNIVFAQNICSRDGHRSHPPGIPAPFLKTRRRSEPGISTTRSNHP